jgi:hypothetical protein
VFYFESLLMGITVVLGIIGTGSGAFLWQALEAGTPILQGESALSWGSLISYK